MALKEGPRGGEVSLVACPACEADIPPRESFPTHWALHCPENPENQPDAEQRGLDDFERADGRPR